MRYSVAHRDNHKKIILHWNLFASFLQSKHRFKKQDQWTCFLRWCPQWTPSLSAADNFSAQVSICLCKSRNYILGHFRGYHPELAQAGILNSRVNSRTVTKMEKSLRIHLMMQTWRCSIKALYSSLSPTEHALTGPFRVLTENWEQLSRKCCWRMDSCDDLLSPHTPGLNLALRNNVRDRRGLMEI